MTRATDAPRISLAAARHPQTSKASASPDFDMGISMNSREYRRGTPHRERTRHTHTPNARECGSGSPPTTRWARRRRTDAALDPPAAESRHRHCTWSSDPSAVVFPVNQQLSSIVPQCIAPPPFPLVSDSRAPCERRTRRDCQHVSCGYRPALRGHAPHAPIRFLRGSGGLGPWTERSGRPAVSREAAQIGSTPCSPG